ncbi:MgtC/SapB family protein [Phosphitispora fastidiosa]|uniref:MgtC/SapB family protein n=1 Tax=Phosphitispora fastidiosa TaxID=2837202 RepID=UPI001E62E490|nr:MgtC/SapB family protein [Phosphitispora fastidiosa]MBU7008313.1 putative Mg2+ transporter-C (MgtC) family protein [Phosphitispora fastidiosa]
MPGTDEIQVIIRIIMAGVLGGLIGLERESLNKSAGFRTHILVCVGSALIMVVSLDLYELYKGATNIDPGRIAAQVVSGIGFLGAGTIMREGATVKGLTTAASLWVVAGVGLALGAGFYFPALVTTGVVFLTLIYLGKVEKLIAGLAHVVVFMVTAENRPGQLGRVGSYLGERGILILNLQMKQLSDDKKVLFEIDTKLPPKTDLNEIMYELGDIPGVYQVEQGE